MKAANGRNIIFLTLILGFSMNIISCKKYLDKKPDIKLTIPTSLDEFQQLLDNNFITENATPGINELGSDNYYLLFSTYQSQSPIVQNSYTWAPDIWQGAQSSDWNLGYSLIYSCNVVLDGLDIYTTTNSETEVRKRNSIYGQALFIRAMTHYSLEEAFGQPYRPSTASSDLGIPLKLTSDLAKISTRSTVAETYNQIISDLKQSVLLVPAVTDTRNRPSKATVFAMLSRAYLTMQDYGNAKKFADSSLTLNSTLYDYNLLGTAINANNPFSGFTSPRDMPEILYPASQILYGVFNLTSIRVDSNLYRSYADDDLRKTVFFRFNSTSSSYSFKTSYSGSNGRLFSGLGVNEMYLVRAECNARMNNKADALLDINTLLRMRWKNTVSFPEVQADDAQDALRKILIERRKELILRGIRWIDLRRLNQDPGFAVTLTRSLNGQTYTLPPNDSKYTYPIPSNEIRLSGIQQNPRE